MITNIRINYFILFKNNSILYCRFFQNHKENQTSKINQNFTCKYKMIESNAKVSTH